MGGDICIIIVWTKSLIIVEVTQMGIFSGRILPAIFGFVLLLYGAHIVEGAPVPEENIVVVQDDSIFKTAKFRAERELEEYHLAKYDVINLIGVEKFSEITDAIQVGVDGMARVPYAGKVKLVGLTLDEARDLLYTRLSRYFKLHEFDVYLKSYGPRKVYVMGNVNSPGLKNMDVDNMNVYAALSTAGGVDSRGRSKHIQLLRQVDNMLYFKEVNIDAFVKEHDLSQNLEIEDGDIIYVPDSGKIIFSQDIAPYINVYSVYRSLTR